MSSCCRQITTTTTTTASSSSSNPFDHRRNRPLRRPPSSISVNGRRGIVVLRPPPEFSKPWMIVEGGEVRRRFSRGAKVNPCCCAVEGARIGKVYEEEKEEGEERRRRITGASDRDRKIEVLVAAAATVVLGVGNRVLYKLALVPLKHYPFFLAQFATFGYVLVYFSVLYFRYHAGIVTDEMLSLPKFPFIAVGLLEALAAASGMAAGDSCVVYPLNLIIPLLLGSAILSGASIPILSQTFLVWQLILSAIFLGRRYRFNQIIGCFLVAIGVVITVASGSGAGVSLKEAGIFWTLLMITSFFLQAADTVLKEIIFLKAAQQLKGRSVDLFVVNSYGSAFQALFISLLLPFLSKLWGVPFSQLPSYLKDGAVCFLNIGSLATGCEGAPLLPLLFVIVNMAFNVSLLHLLKISSAVVSCLASTFSVPLSIYAFTLPLPYIGVASSLPAGFVTGVLVLLAGLLAYAWTPPVASTH